MSMQLAKRAEFDPPHALLSPPAGLRGGLAAIKSKFKQLALVLESGPDHDFQGSSSTEITPPSLPATLNPSSEGGSGSGGSASQQHALEYKWQHGYLPTPSASSAGHISRKGSFVVPLSRASSSKLTDTAIAATGDAAAAAAGDAAADSSLPAGAVPVFGPAGQLSTGSSASTCSKHTAPASVSGPQGAQSNSRVNSNATEVSSGVSSMPAVTLKAPGQIRLGPASLPGPLLLAVSSWLPPAMQRDHWCLSDFVVMKKLYEGYASSICKVRLNNALLLLRHACRAMTTSHG
jgi:hypothetical protein